jgi:hypothetical protein
LTRVQVVLGDRPDEIRPQPGHEHASRCGSGHRPRGAGTWRTPRHYERYRPRRTCKDASEDRAAPLAGRSSADAGDESHIHRTVGAKVAKRGGLRSPASVTVGKAMGPADTGGRTGDVLPQVRDAVALARKRFAYPDTPAT